MTEQAPSGWCLNDNRRENMLTNGELRDWLCGHEIKRMTEDEQRNYNSRVAGGLEVQLEAAQARIKELESGWPAAIRFAAGEVDKLAAHFVGNTKTDGTRDATVYEQGIGCERAGQMLREVASLIEKQGDQPSAIEVSADKMKKLFAQITALEQENAGLRKQLL